MFTYQINKQDGTIGSASFRNPISAGDRIIVDMIEYKVDELVHSERGSVAFVDMV